MQYATLNAKFFTMLQNDKLIKLPKMKFVDFMKLCIDINSVYEIKILCNSKIILSYNEALLLY
jgi:hypothetical protein